MIALTDEVRSTTALTIVVAIIQTIPQSTVFPVVVLVTLTGAFVTNPVIITSIGTGFKTAFGAGVTIFAETLTFKTVAELRTQVSTGLLGAVYADESRLALALIRVRVAFSILGTLVDTSPDGAVLADVVMETLALSHEIALTLVVAVVGTGWDGAVLTCPPLHAVAHSIFTAASQIAVVHTVLFQALYPEIVTITNTVPSIAFPMTIALLRTYLHTAIFPIPSCFTGTLSIQENPIPTALVKPKPNIT